MLYSLEQGQTEKKILDNCVRFGQPIPEAIQNAPELWLGLGLYYTGFQMLTTSRSSGMGVGPISWVVMSDYCIVNDITGEMREDFIYLVNALDATYLNYINDKSKKSKAGK